MDAEGAEGYASGERALDIAGDLSDQLLLRLRATLIGTGHNDCAGLVDAVFMPDGPDGLPVAMCGCGVFAPLVERDEPNGLAPTVGGTASYAAADPIQSTLALIDPTEMYTPQDVELHILDVLYRLETGALFERETVREAYRTAQEYTIAFETAIHESQQSSADRRKAEATVKTQDQFRAMTEAKMMKEAAKQTMHNLRAVLTGYQSVARSVGSTYDAGGSHGAPPQKRAF